MGWYIIISNKIDTLTSMVGQLLEQGAKNMATFADIQAALGQQQADVTAMGTAVNTVVTWIKNQQQVGGITAADADAIIAELQTAHAGLTQSALDLNNALAAPPTPGPGPAGATMGGTASRINPPVPGTTGPVPPPDMPPDAANQPNDGSMADGDKADRDKAKSKAAADDKASSKK